MSIYVHFSHIQFIMSTLVLFGQHWSYLVYFGPILVLFGLTWSYLVNVSLIQSNLVIFCPLRSYSVHYIHFDPIRSCAVYFGLLRSILSTLVLFGPHWSDFVHYVLFSPLWSHSVHISLIWPNLVLFSPLWSYSVHYEYFGPIWSIWSCRAVIGSVFLVFLGLANWNRNFWFVKFSTKINWNGWNSIFFNFVLILVSCWFFVHWVWASWAFGFFP